MYDAWAIWQSELMKYQMRHCSISYIWKRDAYFYNISITDITNKYGEPNIVNFAYSSVICASIH